MDHQAAWTTAAELLDLWRHDVVCGQPPLLFDSALPLDLEPGRITLLGGAPGAGKTALATQALFASLESTPDLHAVVGNVEMPPDALLDRQLARLSGLSATAIMRRQVPIEDLDRLQAGFDAIEAIATRLAFVPAPFDMTTIAEAAVDFAAEQPLVAMVDYVQRIARTGDRRQAIDQVMIEARQLADTGVAVLLISAVGRQRDSKGNSNYAGLGLGSFRESSELEFGADTAFVLTEDRDAGIHRLACVKSRYGETAEHQLRFIKSHQRFEIMGDPECPAADIASEVFGR